MYHLKPIVLNVSDSHIAFCTFMTLCVTVTLGAEQLLDCQVNLVFIGMMYAFPTMCLILACAEYHTWHQIVHGKL